MGEREETTMPVKVVLPTRIESAGNLPKAIDEYVGVVNSGTTGVSLAKMSSPPGWIEPGQTPAFDEYTLVLKGTLRVETREGVIDVPAGRAVIVPRGQWVRYSTPGPEGAEYVAVCVPAFTLAGARRDP